MSPRLVPVGSQSERNRHSDPRGVAYSIQLLLQDGTPIPPTMGRNFLPEHGTGADLAT